jgi:hypothetical protein
MSIGDRRTRSIRNATLLSLSIRLTRCLLWMSLRRRLEENVFGPFDANEVLDEDASWQKNKPVDLHGLEVVRNGRLSG